MRRIADAAAMSGAPWRAASMQTVKAFRHFLRLGSAVMRATTASSAACFWSDRFSVREQGGVGEELVAVWEVGAVLVGEVLDGRARADQRRRDQHDGLLVCVGGLRDGHAACAVRSQVRGEGNPNGGGAGSAAV